MQPGVPGAKDQQVFVKLMVDGEKIGDKKKVDTTEETYRLLNPVVSKIDNGNKKREHKNIQSEKAQ